MRLRRCARRLATALLVPLALLGGTGCPDFNVLSTQEEVAIGKQIAAQIEQKQTVYADPAVQQYVAQVGQRIAQVSDRQDVTYHFTVLEDHKQVNAFAGPGGFMFVYTGFLRAASNEAELAGVLAHETGHVAARHSAKALSNMILFENVAKLVLGSEPGLAAQLAGQIIAQGGMAQMSRQAEYQADQLAVVYMKRAGYDPGALLSFFEKLHGLKESRPSALGKLFATHPPTEERMAHIRSLIGQVGPGGELGADRYHQRLAPLLRQTGPLQPEAASGGAPPGASFRSTTPQGPRPPGVAAPSPAPVRHPGPAASPRAEEARGPVMICRNLTKGNIVASRLVVATTAKTRRRGLLGRHSLHPDEGMLLIPCRSVHTIGMKFPIDIVFLDKQMRVVEIRPSVPPGRPLVACRKAHSTLELAAGVVAARYLQVGDLLRVYHPASPAASPGS